MRIHPKRKLQLPKTASPVVRVEGLESRQLFAVGTFANSEPIQIPANGTGSPGGAMSNPGASEIQVAGLEGTVSHVSVALTGLEHTYDLDLDVILVGPTGRSVILMSDAGDARTDTIDLTFDDSGERLPTFLPISSGTYRATNYNLGDALPAPIPQDPSGLLSTFNGTNPNGTWSLYILDDSPGDVGVLHGGWSISITSDFAPPQVVNGAFFDSTSSHRLQYAFSKSVAESVATGNFSMVSLVDEHTFAAEDFAIDYDDRTNTLGLTYLNGVLPDGYYRLQMSASQWHDDAAIPLDGNNDGVGGDDYYYDFAFLAADANKDRVVDSLDFTTVLSNYGKTSYVYYFTGDFDYNGRVSTSDFNILAGQFGKNLGPLPSPPPNAGPTSGLAASNPPSSAPVVGASTLPSSSPFSLVPIKVGDREATLIDWQ
jgi:subtilisin-like proprotein convertase family protein